MHGDVRDRLADLEPASVQCVVTSPPYWGLRDYHVAGQLGLEDTPAEFVEALVGVFEGVRRVLRSDGTLWLNLGDSYAHGGNGPRDAERWPKQSRSNGGDRIRHAKRGGDFKPKDLIGIPWRVALALQAAGWYLRSDIIWAKPNPMPESVKDRPTKAHEYLFLLAKAERYFYDFEAVAEPVAAKTYTTYGTIRQPNGDGSGLVKSENYGRDVPMRLPRTNGKHSTTDKQSAGHRIVESVAAARAAGNDHDNPFGFTRNLRTVWTVDTQAYPDAHFATFPESLIEPCILAGSREGDVVLDPFAGSGTTLAVARRLGRDSIGIELQPDYLPLIQRRVMASAMPLTEAIRHIEEATA